mmetsp:Transcript_6406/g.15731  ORF Transcript_6406/g.15731 Transcript_6406/m.15731 type:complete len:272 (+) Transcript_6406:365-1180(+)
MASSLADARVTISSTVSTTDLAPIILRSKSSPTKRALLIMRFQRAAGAPSPWPRRRNSAWTIARSSERNTPPSSGESFSLRAMAMSEHSPAWPSHARSHTNLAVSLATASLSIWLAIWRVACVTELRVVSAMMLDMPRRRSAMSSSSSSSSTRSDHLIAANGSAGISWTLTTSSLTAVGGDSVWSDSTALGASAALGEGLGESLADSSVSTSETVSTSRRSVSASLWFSELSTAIGALVLASTIWSTFFSRTNWTGLVCTSGASVLFKAMP